MKTNRSNIRKEIANLIYFIRGKRVIVDSDLAELYGVETKQLNRAVKRNADRFPEDFMFSLSDPELADLRCQIGTSNEGRGGRRYRPFAFTEQGVAMLASAELARKLRQLEYRLGQHDDDIASLFEAIEQLMALPLRKGRLGF